MEPDGIASELPRIDYMINGKFSSYTTADWRWVELVSNMQKRENKEGWNGQGVYWKWRAVQPDEVKKGDILDVDGDGQEESVIKIKDGRALVLDKQEGQIDLSGEAEERGGLSPDYEIERKSLSPSSFVRREGASGINTTTTTNFEEKFIRHIKKRATNEEDYDTIESTFVTEKNETWTTPY
jgi:hypothetical protein